MKDRSEKPRMPAGGDENPEDQELVQFIRRNMESCSGNSDAIEQMQQNVLQGSAGSTGRRDPESAGEYEGESLVDSEIQQLLQMLQPPVSTGELARLPGYRLLKVVGVGGMGFVFSGADIELNREVALKILRPLRLNNPRSVARFNQEARATAHLIHDHIVPVLDVGQYRNIPWFAMSLLKGESLASRLGIRIRLDVTSALLIARQVALALDFAHNKATLHLDIKPDNIWLESDTDQVKLLDFGLTEATSNVQNPQDLKCLPGSPNYIAPERILGQKPDQRSDLFSLGVVMYEMLSGIRPFQSERIAKTLKAVRNRPHKQLSADICHPGVMKLVNDLLAKKPEFRMASAVELVLRIDEVLPVSDFVS